MQQDFLNKVALVTGGSRGIGRAIAHEFAKRGAQVVISYAGNEAAATETVKAIVDAGGKAKAIRFDVADSEACGQAIDDVLKEFGRLDVLVNNAGVAIDGLLMRFKDEDWDKTLDTNLKGAFMLMRATSLAPGMGSRPSSDIALMVRSPRVAVPLNASASRVSVSPG